MRSIRLPVRRPPPPCSLGCGADLYGHARRRIRRSIRSAPRSPSAGDYDPVNAKREPDHAEGKKVSFFGVVLARRDAGGNKAVLTVGLHTLEPRNLCESRDEDTCRVTVSEREFERVEVHVTFASPDDVDGRISVRPGTLLRVIGTIAPGEAQGGAQIVNASYYRQWPHGFFVTTKMAPYMRL